MSKSVASLTLSVDNTLATAAYQQIAEQLRHLIESRRLNSGDRLPSSRQLAKTLGVSRITAQSSYELLAAEGYVLSLPRRGLFVAERLPTIAPRPRPTPSVKTGARTPEAPRKAAEPMRFDSGASVADFPNNWWRQCLRRSWLNPQPALLEGRLPGGDPGLKQAIAQYLHSVRGLHCQPEQILVTAGNRDALSTLFATLRRLQPPTSQASTVWLENPCYPPLANGLRNMGLAMTPLSVDAEGACVPGDIKPEARPMAALMTPARQYPLGMTMSPQRRQEWLAFCAEQQESKPPCYLVEDDYDSEFIYQGWPQAPLMASDTTQSTVLVGSFSKSLFKALRLGYIVAPMTLAKELLVTQQTLGSSASLPLQPALAAFLSSDHFGTHLRKMRRLYRQRRDHLVQALNAQNLPLDVQPPPGGMHLVASLNNGLSDQAICQQAYQEGLTLTGLAQHYWSHTHHDNANKQGLILGFTARDPTYHEQAITRLVRAMRLDI